MSFPRPLHTRLVLGSASPRRAQLLRQLGLPFRQVVSPEKEPVPAGEGPEDFVQRSARAKSGAVLRAIQADPPTLIIGADTVVVVEGRIMGKPADPEDAAAQLRALSGRTHQVFTGISLLAGNGAELSAWERTSVTMRRLRADDIRWYLATGEPLDKAGAYGIQGYGARFIERIEGCYYNVVGLPLARLSAMLEMAGYRFPQMDHQPPPSHD